MCGFVVFAVVYTWGARHHGNHMNTVIGGFDQISTFAKDIRLSHYSLTFPRQQMPVYPLFQSLFYRAGWSETEFFEVAKVVNVMLSLVLLLGLGIIFFRQFPLLIALNLFLITAFTVFIFKASYVQPELLYFFLNFVSFLLMIEMFQRPTRGKAVALGLVAGLAYLTKAANLPGLVIFLAIALGRDVARAISKKQWKSRPFVLLVLVGMSFTAFIFPYAKTTKRLYGSYFFNLNSSFFIWHDNWQEAVHHLEEMGPIENRPMDQRPSLTSYVKSHSVAQIGERILRGGAEMILVAMMAYGYFEYFIAFLGVFGLLMVIRWRQVSQEIRKQAALSLFIGVYFGLHLLLYAFYVPIAPGERFSLSQFLPAMYVLTMASLKLSTGHSVTLFKRKLDLFRVFNAVIFAVLCLDITSILTKKLLWMHGGS